MTAEKRPNVEQLRPNLSKITEACVWQYFAIRQHLLISPKCQCFRQNRSYSIYNFVVLGCLHKVPRRNEKRERELEVTILSMGPICIEFLKEA